MHEKEHDAARIGPVGHTGEGKRQKRGYQGYIEYFGIYSQDTKKVYMISVDECYVGEMSLRLMATGKQGKNQYSIGVRWAQNYEI